MINKDTNIGLLFIIVICCCVLMFSAIYYQYSFSSLYNDYEEHSEILEEKMEDITNYRVVLAEAKQDIEIGFEKEEWFGEQYEVLREKSIKNEEYKKEIEDLLDELKDEKSKSIDAEKEVKYYSILNNELQGEVDDLHDKIKKLKRQIREFEA